MGALEESLLALISANRFILKKWGTNNPARTQAIQRAADALGLDVAECNALMEGAAKK